MIFIHNTPPRVLFAIVEKTACQGNSKVQREHGAVIPRRATARVPTPLYTAPALTMITKGTSPATSHCKGGGGVERGGDPCGRPAGRQVSWRLRPLHLGFYIALQQSCSSQPTPSFL